MAAGLGISCDTFVNTEAEKDTALAAVTKRQPVKMQ
jgi:hypothetical protein